MTARWITWTQQLWGRTARFRSGASAAIRTGGLVAGTAYTVGTAPTQQQPNVTDNRQPAQVRIEREGNRRLGDYARYEVDRRANTQSRDIINGTNRSAQERTQSALARSGQSRSGQSRTQGRSRSSGRQQGRGR